MTVSPIALIVVVTADLNVVTNTQPAMLRNSHQCLLLRVAKSVTAKHRPAFDEATLTDDDAPHHRNVGKDGSVRPPETAL